MQLTRLNELDDAWATTSPTASLDALKTAAPRLKERIVAAGPAVSVRTYDLVTFPYPTAFAFSGAAKLAPRYVMLRNRVQLVQVQADGRLWNILINPTEPERSKAAPYFARQIARFGKFVSRRLLSKSHGTMERALKSWGVRPEDIDYITFDHLHVQDVRGLLGTEVPEPGESRPTPALLPNAKLLAQRQELAVFDNLHPLEEPWYVRDGLRGVSKDKLVALDGDYLIGPGMAIVRTPGHTLGNHTLVVVTDRGVWTISENGVAVDSYAPRASRIRGLKSHAKHMGFDVILNGNTREASLAQYSSMLLERLLADACPDAPEFPQHFPSSELTKNRLAPGIAPTYSHGHITYGTMVPGR